MTNQLMPILASFCENPVHNQREINDITRALKPLQAQIEQHLPLKDILDNLPYNRFFLCQEGDTVSGVICAQLRSIEPLQIELQLFTSGYGNLSEHFSELVATMFAEGVTKVVVQLAKDDVRQVTFEQAGFRVAGVLRQDKLIDGVLTDTVILERLPNDQAKEETKTEPKPEVFEEDLKQTAAKVDTLPLPEPAPAKKYKFSEPIDGVKEYNFE